MESQFIHTQIPTHDAYFRTIFSDVRHAQGLLCTILPQSILQHLDIDKLQRIEDGFPGNNGGEIRGDLIFLCPMLDMDTECEIAIIFEHKSHRDNRAKEQILHEWLHLRQRRRRLPIVPILFYHGIRPWFPTTFGDEASSLPESIAGLQPHLPLVFVDLCRQSDETLSNPILDGMARLALYLLKNGPTAALHIGVLLGLLKDAARAGDVVQLGESWIYLNGRGGLKSDQVRALSATLGEDTPMRFKSTFEQLFEEGVEKGIEQGIERGLELDKIEIVSSMLAKNFDWKTIQEITHVDESAYHDLRIKHGML